MFENPQERKANKKYYNKCSENSRSQIVFRTDTFQKLTLGAAEKCTEGVISEMTTTSMGIRKNATIIKKLAYDISVVAENCKS